MLLLNASVSILIPQTTAHNPTMTPLYNATRILADCFFSTCYDFEIHGAENIPSQGSVIFAANHVSFFDPPAIGARIPRQINYFARDTLYNGWFGQYLLALDTIPVARENADIRSLKAIFKALKKQGAIAIYPEGTRFTLGKQQRLRAKLAQAGHTEHLRAAERLQNLLPVRIGGPAACFRAAPEADVLIVGHVGFEGAASLRHFLSGRVYNTTIRVRIWRTSCEDLPPDPEARGEWLNHRWEELDSWIQGASSSETKSSESEVSGSSQSE